MADQQLVKGALPVRLYLTTQGTPPGVTAPPSSSFSLWQGTTQLVSNTALVAQPGDNYSATSTGGTTLSATFNGVGQPQYTEGNVSLASGTTLSDATGLYLVVNSYDGFTSYAVVDIVEGNNPQNFALAFFSPSAGDPPSLSASWQQPAQGQPDSYNIKLGNAPGTETQALNVPGSATSRTFPAYGHGTVYGVVTALYGGAESTPSNESSAAISLPAPNLAAAASSAGGTVQIILTVT